MKIKRNIFIIVALVLCIMVAFVACNKKPNNTDNNENENTVTITWVNGDSVLKTDTVQKGSKATNWTPTNGAYAFVDWCEDKELSLKYDFDKVINENITIYAKFKGPKQDDNRNWYITGKGIGTLKNHQLSVANPDSKLLMQIQENPNTNMHVIENITLYANDKFFFYVPNSWDTVHGIGYFKDFDKQSGKVVQRSEIYFESDKTTQNEKQNYIKVVKPGVYTFYLSTNPGEELYDNIQFVRTADVTSRDNLFDMHIKYKGNNFGEQDNFLTNSKYTLSNISGTSEYFGSIKINEADLDSGKNYAHFELYNVAQDKTINNDGTAENSTFKLEVGEYHIKFNSDNNLVQVKKLNYYIVGTFVDENNNKIDGKIKEGITPMMELKNGVYEVEFTATNMLEFYPEIDATKGVMSIRVAYGTEFRRKNSFGDLENNRASFTLQAGTYIITFDPETYEVTIK